MLEITERYHHAYNNLELLVNAAFQLSINTHGRIVSERRLEVGAQLFAKLCSHARATLALAPIGLANGNSSRTEFWDISSMAVLARSAIDTYFMFYYLAIDSVDSNTHDFRFLLWDYHGENRRLKQLKLTKSVDLKLVEEDVSKLKDALISHQVYCDQKKEQQKRFRDAETSTMLTNSELSKLAGIDEDYYKSMYIFLSSYVHAYPFALTQLAIFQAGNDESLRLMKVVLEYCTGFLCLGVRDFLKLCPDQK